MFYVYTSCAYDENAGDDGNKGGGKFTNDRFINIGEDEEVDYFYLNSKTEHFTNYFAEDDFGSSYIYNQDKKSMDFGNSTAR